MTSHIFSSPFDKSRIPTYCNCRVGQGKLEINFAKGYVLKSQLFSLVFTNFISDSIQTNKILFIAYLFYSAFSYFRYSTFLGLEGKVCYLYSFSVLQRQLSCFQPKIVSNLEIPSFPQKNLQILPLSPASRSFPDFFIKNVQFLIFLSI